MQLPNMLINPLFFGKYLRKATSAQSSLQNGVARIPIHGVLTKRTDTLDVLLGTTSYESIEQSLRVALDDSAVESILLDIDSPGGEVNGLFDLADFIYEARNIKPIYAMANDAAYSAAYALASSANKVILSRTAGVGSIGVITNHVDMSKFEEMMGLRYTAVFAGDKKNDMSPHEPLSKSAEHDLQKEVNRLYEMFVSLVARNRGISEESIRRTEAGIYFGSDAINAGLADEIKVFKWRSVMGQSDFEQNNLGQNEKEYKYMKYAENQEDEEKEEEACKLKKAKKAKRKAQDDDEENAEHSDEDEDENAETEEDEEKDGKKSRVGSYKSDAIEIAKLCKLSGSDRLGEFIEQGLSAKQAKRVLLSAAENTRVNLVNTFCSKVRANYSRTDHPLIINAKKRR